MLTRLIKWVLPEWKYSDCDIVVISCLGIKPIAWVMASARDGNGFEVRAIYKQKTKGWFSK